MTTALEQAKEALQDIANGEARKTKKNDKCIHGMYGYEECEECLSDFARSALAALDAATEAQPVNDELLRALREVRFALQYTAENPGAGEISGTLMMMHHPETVIEFIDRVLTEHARRAPQSLLAAKAAGTEEGCRAAVTDDDILAMAGFFTNCRHMNGWHFDDGGTLIEFVRKLLPLPAAPKTGGEK
jgi:hypothetical protein